MAATAITGNQVAGIKYTWRTDTSLDWPSVPNGTYFFDLNTQQVYYKDINSSIIDIFNSSLNKVAAIFTPGVAGSPNTITHNLGTSDIIVQLWDSVTGEVINADIDNATATTVDITFGLNPVGDVKAVII